MATVGETINGALRKIGVLAAGRQPRAADQADTLATLVGMYRQWINNGTFGRLHDVIPLQSFTAQPNTHVYRNSLAVTTISLPELVVGCPQIWCCESWRWFDGIYPNEPSPYGRVSTTPRDASVIVISDGPTKATAEFLYDGHRKEWCSVHNLTLTDEAPFSQRDAKGLESVLALQIVDEFAGQIGQMTTGMATQFMSALANRQASRRVEVAGEYF
jgi:hypothetical protein